MVNPTMSHVEINSCNHTLWLWKFYGNIFFRKKKQIVRFQYYSSQPSTGSEHVTMFNWVTILNNFIAECHNLLKTDNIKTYKNQDHC